MLQGALRLIAQGEALSSEQLARRLSVSAEVAREAVRQLARLGYLRPAGAACTSADAACTSAGTACTSSGTACTSAGAACTSAGEARSGACAGCPAAGSCLTSTPLWSLTEKGRRAARSA